MFHLLLLVQLALGDHCLAYVPLTFTCTAGFGWSLSGICSTYFYLYCWLWVITVWHMFHLLLLVLLALASLGDHCLAYVPLTFTCTAGFGWGRQWCQRWGRQWCQWWRGCRQWCGWLCRRCRFLVWCTCCCCCCFFRSPLSPHCHRLSSLFRHHSAASSRLQNTEKDSGTPLLYLKATVKTTLMRNYPSYKTVFLKPFPLHFHSCIIQVQMMPWSRSISLLNWRN